MAVQVNNQNANPVPVSDAGGSLTVDAPVGTPAFVRLSDGAAAITTLPVSLASVPSHAVTNDGTFAVQESGAALTALQLIDNIVLAEDAVHASGDPGVMLLSVRKSTITSTAGADGDYAALITDPDGYLQTTDRYTLSMVNQLTAIGAAVHAEDAAHASGESGMMLLAVRSDTPASTSGTNGDYSALITDSTGRLHCNVSNSVSVTNAGTFTVQDTPSTSGGLSVSRAVSAASNNATVAKASAGQVYSIAAFNLNAAARYLKIYNKATTPAPATDNALLVAVFMIPGNTAGAGVVYNIDKGIACSSGISWAIVTGISDTDNTSTAASEQVVSVYYK